MPATGLHGYGGYVVGFARDLGAARIVATASTPAGREQVRELGADVVLDHADPTGPAPCPQRWTEARWTWRSTRRVAPRPGACWTC